MGAPKGLLFGALGIRDLSCRYPFLVSRPPAQLDSLRPRDTILLPLGSICLMPSERVQRQVDRLLDEAEEASVQENWELVLRRAKHVLTLTREHPNDEDFIS